MSTPGKPPNTPASRTLFLILNFLQISVKKKIHSYLFCVFVFIDIFTTINFRGLQNCTYMQIRFIPEMIFIYYNSRKTYWVKKKALGLSLVLFYWYFFAEKHIQCIRFYCLNLVFVQVKNCLWILHLSLWYPVSITANLWMH